MAAALCTRVPVRAAGIFRSAVLRRTGVQRSAAEFANHLELRIIERSPTAAGPH